MTLAIIPALIVMCQGQRFAIPKVSLLELVKLEKDEARQEIGRVQGAPVYRLHGRWLSLVDLKTELELGAAPSQAAMRAMGGDAVNIVFLHADGRQFGLVVDEIISTEEIVMKPLGKELKGLAIYAGATVMGDGRVTLVLDVRGFAQRPNVLAASAKPIRPEVVA